ncbi:unnamed protein product [Closterium sp. NIES-53]
MHLSGQVQKLLTTRERRVEESAEVKSAEEPTVEEKSAEAKSAEEQMAEDQLDDDALSDVVEVLGGGEGELRSTRSNLGKPAKKLGYHARLPSISYSTLLDDAEADVDLPELDPDMHADPEHRWDIATMTVKEALASWEGKAVKAAMDEEIKSLITNGTWELSPLLWYSALDAVLTGADWKKSQVDKALYFKVGENGLMCWVLVYVDDLLAASSILAMLKELLEAAFKLHAIKPVKKYLGLDIVCDRPARKQWLHQQVYFGGGPKSLCLVGYADTNDAGDKQIRTSMGGYVFVFGGAAVSWSSAQRSHRPSRSTSRPRRPARRLVVFASFLQEGLGLKGNLNHMERRYAWLQPKVKRGKIALQYILTTEQPADFVTKALHFPAFNRCSVAIGQVYLADVGDGDDEVQ